MTPETKVILTVSVFYGLSFFEMSQDEIICENTADHHHR